MDSDFQQQNYQHHFQDQQRHQKQQQQQRNNLTRFRSAPSSYFASFLGAIDTTIPSNEPIHGSGSCQQQQLQPSDFSNSRPLSPETENIFARFMSTLADDDDNNNNNNSSQKLCSISENSAMDQSQYVVKQEIETLQQQMIYRSQSKPPLARSTTVMDRKSFQGGGNNNFNHNNGGTSGLTRHSSSPAGFFSNIMNMDNDFGVIKGMGNLVSGHDSQINFSSANSTTASELMNQSPEIATKKFKSENNNNINNESNYMTGYTPMTSWDDSVLSENQGGDEGRNRPPLLSHHLSLPNTSAELSAMENLLQFQDTVPCRIRAKRGCATHPRSIAERVRRTKISERMRKLQDLVPNMDKQTNTSDMLDLAVEYIKDLQDQVKSLTDYRAKCTCC